MTEIHDTKVIIKRLLISTVLYLPLCFFIWFYSATLLVLPLKYLLQFVLTTWQPDLFNTVSQNYYMLSIETLIFPTGSFRGQGDKLAVLDVAVNPMIYGYGLAVISGLTVSIPELSPAKKIKQILYGYIIVVIIQTFGCFWEAMKHLVFYGSPDSKQAILDTGLFPDLIALFYQMSYLIFPAVIPVAAWIIMNKNFIGIITGLDAKINGNLKDTKVSDKKVTSGVNMAEQQIAAKKEIDTAESNPAVNLSFEDKLCQYMIEKGRLKQDDLIRGERLHKENPETSLVPLLVRLGLASERDVASSLSEVMELEVIKEKDYPETINVETEIPIRFMQKSLFVPVAEDEETINVIMVYPSDEFTVKAIRMASGKKLDIKIGLPSEVENAIEKYFGGGRSAMGQIVESLTDESAGDEEDVDHLRDLASEAPVIRLVNIIMQRAVESRASDIHVEPFENRLKVRYRIDGVLQEVESPPARSTAAVISRIKIMAKLNIAERRLPQDGRIMLRVQGKELDLRVSTVPTSYGESVVMRILDRESIVFDFHELGFTDRLLKPFKKSLELPHGIMLVTGPTGSGKTTTLYTALQQLNTEERKIITVEDPVEYQLTGINQIQVKSSIGLDFTSALRAIVRQDPDVIMIGEMRDLETAKIAIQSALTGHLVLSTIHTNDAAGGVTRMLDMGVEDYLLTSTVNGILAQRLVRKLDQSTMKKEILADDVVKSMGLDKLIKLNKYAFYKPVPSATNLSGYSGRMSILEFLEMSDSIRRIIMQHGTAGDIQKQACKDGMTTIYEDGLLKCLEGRTSYEEVLRVSQEN